VFDLPSSAPVQPGEIIRLSVRTVEPVRGVWVPVSALTERERGLWSVYVARSEGSDWLAQPDTVEVIHAAGEEVYVRGGLRDGDRVILDGLHRLTPGQRVAPVEVRIAVSDRSDG
jgi:multidrug efflux pump subunit AcrA (membrane-fusion protein)